MFAGGSKSQHEHLAKDGNKLLLFYFKVQQNNSLDESKWTSCQKRIRRVDRRVTRASSCTRRCCPRLRHLMPLIRLALESKQRDAPLRPLHVSENGECEEPVEDISQNGSATT